jgi:hypothetical protein
VPDTAKLSLMNLTGRMIRLATPTDGVDGPAASVCQDAGCQNLHRKEPPTMSVSMIGLDTAKSVFQVHGVNEAGKAELKRKLRKGELIAFFEKLET